MTAELSHPSSAKTTITVSATAGANTVAGDFTLSADTVLTIAAGATSSTETVTIEAVDNTSDDLNREVTVSASASNTQGVSAPADVTLTIEDDEGEPTVRLILTPDSIGEDGGSSTVTAELSHTSIAETTITVSAAAVLPAVAADFTLSDDTTLSIAAGATTSTGTVTIAAVNNGVDAPDRQVTVSASASNTQGVTKPADVTLTLEDDDEAPTVTLILTPDSISEKDGSSTVTATLSHVSSEATEVTVSENEGVFTLSDNRTLTIAAGDTQSTGTVTIAAVDNDVDAPDRQVAVSAVATNTQGVTAPAAVTLTLEDDDEAPTVTLILSKTSIPEDGGSSTVTAELSHPSSEETTVTVMAAAVEPAVATDFALSVTTTLSIAAGATSSTGTVTIAAVNNSVDAPDRTVTVSAGASNSQGVNAPADRTLTLEDDEEAPTATLILTPDSIGENGKSSAVSATLSHASSEATTITVSAAAVLPAVAADFALSDSIILTIDPGNTTSTGTVTITAVDNDVDAPDREVTVSAGEVTNTQGVTAPAEVTLTIEDDEEAPTATLVLTPASIGEDSGSSAVSATLSHPSIAETTITVSAAAGANAVAMDFWLSTNTTLTIAAGATSSTGAVTITAFADDEDGPDKQVTVSASAANTQGVDAPEDVTLTIEDENATPTVTLILTPDSIGEDGESTTVTAELSHASSATTTITVLAAAGANAAAEDFTLSDNTTLTIDPGDTTSTGTVTIAAVNNGVDTPDKTVTVSAGATNSQGVDGPAAVALTIEDDDEAPTATLILTPDSISENDGLSTLTAELSHPSSEETTVTVSAAAVSPGVAADFELGANKILSIAAGATESTGTVTIEAVDNGVDAPDRTVSVSAGAVNSQGVNSPANKTLTIEDDEEAPTAKLVLTPASIGEDGKSSAVSATLSHPSIAETTLTVSAAAGANAVEMDFWLSTNKTLTIAAGATESTEMVTITAFADDEDGPDKEVTVSASASNSQGVTAPADVTLTIEDKNETPTVTLILTPESIGEDGASSTVTATLNHTSSEETTITVSATAVSPAVAADFVLSTNKILTIAAGATSSAGAVTIAAVNNSVDALNKEVTVAAGAVNSQGVNAPADRTLTIVDDDDPTVTLILTSDSIGEDGGSSTVTATLDQTSGKTTTITVSATAVEPAVAADFTLSANTTLSIAAGATSSTGAVTIGAVNNGVDAPDKTVTVSAGASNTQGVTAPADVTLTLEDDEEAPTATLILTPDSIGEDGGSSAVSATLSHPSSEETTITVSATALEPAVAADFVLSANTTLSIAAGATSSTETVTIEAVNNGVDAPDKQVTVSASASNSQGVTGPADVTLTIEDDEEAPTVTLILTPDSISENGGSSAVSATLSHTSSEATTITVSAAAGTNTVAGDFTLSADTTLSIAAGATTSTGTVTIDAVNNGVDAPDKQVTVSASASNSQGVNGPADKTLTLEDDEEAPTVTLILTPDSIDENGGSSTVTAELSHTSIAETTITVSAAALEPAVAADFALSATTTLSIAAGATSSTGTVTIGAVNNGVDAPDKQVTVSASASNAQGVTAPADKTLTLEDDEEAPTATLILTPDSIGENGGSTTVTAELSHASSEATTITVSAAAGANTVAADFTLSATTTLSIAAGATSSTGTVTIGAVNNGVDAPDKQVTVSAGASNSQGVTAPADRTLAIVDDENPTVTLILTPDSIGENGGSSTVTAELNQTSSAQTTITVSATAGANTVAADFVLSATTTLTIDAGDTTSTGTVTIGAVNNEVDAPDKTVTVSASATNTQGVIAPADVTLTIEDDEDPTVTLILTPDSIGENGGSSTVTATLSQTSGAQTTITVSATAGANTVAADFTLSDNTTLTIDAGDTTSTGTVTIAAVNNEVDAPDKTVTVSASRVQYAGGDRARGRDADHRGRRGSDGDADSDTELDRRGRRFEHGDGEARSNFERGNHHHGDSDGGR